MRYYSICLFVTVGLAVVLGGCGGPDLDDPETLDRILAEAVEMDELQERGQLFYSYWDSQTPYTGWGKLLYPDGQVSELFQIKKGKHEGLDVAWYRNGQKEYEAERKDGKLLDGIWWKLNGEKSSEVIDGNGKLVTWWDNGQKLQECTYKNGKMDGLDRVWERDGKLVRETTYKKAK